MACRYREELVGKRFISVRSPQKLKIHKISEWEWRSGVVRAVSNRDTTSLDLSVLIEFDDIDWSRREWVRVHDIFQLFLVEHTLVWAERPDPDKPRQSLSWPGLSFRAVVDKAGLAACKRKPVEFLVDRFLGLVEEKEIQIFQEGDENSHATAVARCEVQTGLKEWLDYQDGQKILLTTPTVLVGYRLEVYRAEGTTQWYTAVIQSYNHASKTLSVTDDTVLEEHNEDPTLIQMHLIDDHVVDSILRGVEIGGIAPRRRPRAVKDNKDLQNNTSRSNVNSNHTPTSSRNSVPKKARTPQQASVASSPVTTNVITPVPSPAPGTPDRHDNKGDKTPKQQKNQAAKERKRRSDVNTVSLSEATNSKKKTRSDDTSCRDTNKAKDSVVNSQVDVESTPQLRVSPRTTPSKERARPYRNRERDKDSSGVPSLSGVSDIAATGSPLTGSSDKSSDNNKTSNTNKSSKPVRSRQPKEDAAVESPSSRKNDSPRNWADSPRGSPRRRSLSRTPVHTEAEAVIKGISGSKKDNKKASVSEKDEKKSDKKPTVNSAKSETSDSKTSVKDPITTTPSAKPSIPESTVDTKTGCSFAVSSSKGNNTKNTGSKTVEDKTNELVEQKVQEIKTAFKQTIKDGSNKSGQKTNKEKRTQRASKKEKDNSPCTNTGKKKEKKPKVSDSAHENVSEVKPASETGSVSCSSSSSLNESGDNMHFVKKKQLVLTGGAPSSTPQNAGIPTSTNIDLSQSVTEQISRVDKLSSVNGEEKSGSVSSSLSSPISDTFPQRDAECPQTSRDPKLPGSSGDSAFHRTNTASSASISDERSQSRNSDSRCSSAFSGDEAKRPSSRVDIKSVKNSPASSPLIVDKSEPLQIYRDPELMSKNPVRSNVPTMHSSHKSYPQLHNPVPTQASRPSSVGMPSTPTLSSSMEHSSRTPVIPSVAYPSPMNLNPSALPGASLSNLLPPGLHQLDPATLVLHQQIHAASIQQQQVAAALAQQYNNALSMSYPPRASLSKAQLEHLWQQKYPSLPVPPPWLLAKSHDELMSGQAARMMQHEQEQLERERLESMERERDHREREQRERKERERRERDRIEKARLNRERQEREKIEAERAAERERLEREKEKERLEREHRERLERERNRILKETAVDSQAAVDQHFSESLRLASERNWKKVPNHHHHQVNMQDGYRYHNNTNNSANYRCNPKYTAAQTGMWPQPSITLGTGKPKHEAGSGHPKMGEIKPDEKIKQEQLRETDFRFAELMRKQQQQQQQDEMMMKHKELMMAQKEFNQRSEKRLGWDHKPDMKPDMGKDVKPGLYPGYPGKQEHPVSSAPGPVKQEVGTASFSLYGYQPEKYSFISADQLQSYEQDKIKVEKGMGMDPKLGRAQSPRKKDLSNPPPLIKDLDTKSHSSVIVKNSRDTMIKSSSPHGGHYGTHMSPHQQPKPAHTPERPHSSNSSPGAAHMSPAIAHQQHLAAMREAHNPTSRSQSPLRIASPQQLSAAVMQPMDYRCSPNVKNRGSPGSANVSPHGPGGNSPAIAQPPVSLPQSSVSFTYSYIQQGMVPNPIYSNNSKNPDSQRTVSVTGTAQVPRAAQSPPGSNPHHQQPHSAIGTKRKGQREANNRKRQKGNEMQSPGNNNNNPLNLSVPCTTPQIVTNQSPYTTSSGSVPSSVMCTTQSSTPSSLALSQAVVNNRLSGLTGFMDSFKSFVENTVQHAFMSDPDLGKNKDGQLKKPSSEQLKDIQQQHLATQQQQQQLAQKPPQPYKPKTSLERSCTPVGLQQNSNPPAQDEASNLSNSGSNSAMSYVDSINRVANGQVDTDSDTLSAPSPPPHLKQENNNPANPSPHKTAKHPNLKKAWLQRHSDEDKQEKPPAVGSAAPMSAPVSVPVPGPPVVTDNAPTAPMPGTPPGGEQDKEQVKTCYVNCSYISPSNSGGSKSPITAIQPGTATVPNGTVETEKDESTTSASETETQPLDSSASSRKRNKNKKEKAGATNAKKIKIEPTEDTESNSSTSAATATGKKKSSRRSKEGKNKGPSDNMSEEQIKKIVENCKESVKEKETKPTEEAYDKKFDFDDSNDQLNADNQSEMDTNPSEEPQDQESNPKSEKKERKKNKEKKEKKIKKEKGQKEKEREKEKEKEREKEKQEDSMTDDQEADTKYVPPPSMLKVTELKAQQQTTVVKSSGSSGERVSEAVLKRTCEPFLQDDSCSEVTPKLMKCRECKMTPTQRGKTVPNIFCRFYAFRRLKYSQRGFVTYDGFSELSDAEQDDIDPWIPKFPIIEPRIDVETARFIIGRVGDKFCELIQQEKEAQICAGDNAKIVWKRAVTGVREMCDVCDTTLFNMHWFCPKCGFVVCLDCYKVKHRALEEGSESDNEDSRTSSTGDGDGEKDQRQWLTCSANRQPHDVDKLMLTQIIPADALWEVGRMVHEVRERWGINRTCPCSPKLNAKKNGIKTELTDAIKNLAPKKKLVNGVGSEEEKSSKTKNGNIKNAVYNPDSSSSPLSLLADVASMDSEKTRERSESPLLTKGKKEGKNGKSYTPITEPVSPGSSEKKVPQSCSTLRELLTKTAGGKVKNSSDSNKRKSKNSNQLTDIIQKVVEKQTKDGDKTSVPSGVNSAESEQPMKLLHYTPRPGGHQLVRETPIIVHNLTETSVLYPDVPHSWLCDGRLLRLHDPRHRGNLKIFMEQWKRGQPVLVSGVDKYINTDLWKPEYFSKHFGEVKNDLINCRTSWVVVGHPMKHFWDGFSCVEERLVDEDGVPMLLKLKDWPPGDDFSDVLPQQFNDLMQALPLPEYTKRDGRLNLASRLPDFLVKPDLGPKMYIAYGSAQYPKEGTTNLHLDVSDATNLMVHVGYLDEEERGHIDKDSEAIKAMEMARCDQITKRRIREVRETPGALWHIFDAVDADKIRDFLNKVGKERGQEVEQHHDPIHDQSWYLDEDLRDRLAKEYGVLGYTILQCAGDAVFIPAGAPHQVRNLNNCIKVAEDFVSPENVHHCFQLTQEFRDLSEGHSNHEDKLQIKNIIYHAMKDATAVLNESDPDEFDF